VDFVRVPVSRRTPSRQCSNALPATRGTRLRRTTPPARVGDPSRARAGQAHRRSAATRPAPRTFACTKAEAGQTSPTAVFVAASGVLVFCVGAWIALAIWALA
jgi:hypothetical protein